MNLRIFLFAFFLFFVAASASLFGQIREDRWNPTFDKMTEKITYASGWMLNKGTGKWIENQNVIADRECPSYWVSHMSQNFRWIQFAAIFYKGTKYYIFLFERQDGEYKYPKIQEDWQEETRTYFFILDSLQYHGLISVVNSKDQRDIQFKSKYSGYITDKFEILGGENIYNEENLLAKIAYTLDNGSSSEYCLVINSQQINQREVIRFRLPEFCLISKYIKDAYFEIEFSDFVKLFTL